MGGVAGSAGVFSTVQDVGKYCQALLDRLAGRPSALARAAVPCSTTPRIMSSVTNAAAGSTIS